MKVQTLVERLNELCEACGKYGSQQCVGCLIEAARQQTILDAMKAQKETKAS